MRRPVPSSRARRNAGTRRIFKSSFFAHVPSITSGIPPSKPHPRTRSSATAGPTSPPRSPGGRKTRSRTTRHQQGRIVARAARVPPPQGAWGRTHQLQGARREQDGRRVAVAPRRPERRGEEAVAQLEPTDRGRRLETARRRARGVESGETAAAAPAPTAAPTAAPWARAPGSRPAAPSRTITTAAAATSSPTRLPLTISPPVGYRTTRKPGYAEARSRVRSRADAASPSGSRGSRRTRARSNARAPSAKARRREARRRAKRRRKSRGGCTARRTRTTTSSWRS